jgi:pSer/pThr/pTyr-binding forkhead associated (FHA) protein
VASLLILRDEAVHRCIELSQPELTIGRGPQNDIVLEDPEMLVSRFHAAVRREDAGYVLIDLNSQNGTWVADERVARVQLEVGVPVAIGPYQLILEDGPR